MTEEELLAARLCDLAEGCYTHGRYTYTDFLSLPEQDLFHRTAPAFSYVPYTLFGGAEGCERVMVRFGDGDTLGYAPPPFPIACLSLSLPDARFADPLSHRDCLGALMNLGIERDTLGDIAILDNVGYLFAKEDIAAYVAQSLTKVRRTDVKATITDALPEGELYRTERRSIQANGERLDALCAKVFSLSREEAQSLFKKRLVFADGKQIDSTSYIPRENEKISVRGHGRFIYVGPKSLTRKGKMNIEVELYI